MPIELERSTENWNDKAENFGSSLSRRERVDTRSKLRVRTRVRTTAGDLCCIQDTKSTEKVRMQSKEKNK